MFEVEIEDIHHQNMYLVLASFLPDQFSSLRGGESANTSVACFSQKLNKCEHVADWKSKISD